MKESKKEKNSSGILPIISVVLFLLCIFYIIIKYNLVGSKF